MKPREITQVKKDSIKYLNLNPKIFDKRTNLYQGLLRQYGNEESIYTHYQTELNKLEPYKKLSTKRQKQATTQKKYYEKKQDKIIEVEANKLVKQVKAKETFVKIYDRKKLFRISPINVFNNKYNSYVFKNPKIGYFTSTIQEENKLLDHYKKALKSKSNNLFYESIREKHNLIEEKDVRNFFDYYDIKQFLYKKLMVERNGFKVNFNIETIFIGRKIINHLIIECKFGRSGGYCIRATNYGGNNDTIMCSCTYLHRIIALSAASCSFYQSYGNAYRIHIPTRRHRFAILRGPVFEAVIRNGMLSKRRTCKKKN